MVWEEISGGTDIATVGMELKQGVGKSEPQRSGFYSTKEELVGDQDVCRRSNVLRGIVYWDGR